MGLNRKALLYAIGGLTVLFLTIHYFSVSSATPGLSKHRISPPQPIEDTVDVPDSDEMNEDVIPSPTLCATAPVSTWTKGKWRYVNFSLIYEPSSCVLTDMPWVSCLQSKSWVMMVGDSNMRNILNHMGGGIVDQDMDKVLWKHIVSQGSWDDREWELESNGHSTRVSFRFVTSLDWNHTTVRDRFQSIIFNSSVGYGVRKEEEDDDPYPRSPYAKNTWYDGNRPDVVIWSVGHWSMGPHTRVPIRDVWLPALFEKLDQGGWFSADFGSTFLWYLLTPIAPEYMQSNWRREWSNEQVESINQAARDLFAQRMLKLGLPPEGGRVGRSKWMLMEVGEMFLQPVCNRDASCDESGKQLLVGDGFHITGESMDEVTKIWSQFVC